MRLVRLTDSDGDSIWVNPEMVVALSNHDPFDEDVTDRTLITFVEGVRQVVVRGEPSDVAEDLRD